MNGFFDFARKEGFPTQFPAHKTAVTVDVLEAGLILASVMLILCFYMIIPGFRRKYVSSKGQSYTPQIHNSTLKIIKQYSVIMKFVNEFITLHILLLEDVKECN
jgi:hypothetical protein